MFRIAVEYYFDENKIEVLTDKQLSGNDEKALIEFREDLNYYRPFLQEDFEIIITGDDKYLYYSYNGDHVFKYEYEVFDAESLIFCFEDLNFRYHFYNETAFMIFVGDK